MKKITFLLSFFAIILYNHATFSQTFTVNNIKYNVTDAVNKTVEVGNNSNNLTLIGAITIPESVTNDSTTYTVTSFGITTIVDVVMGGSDDYGSFEGCTGVTSIVLPNTITSIGQQAFYNCTNLISINIPNSVTSIGVIAFSRCTSLTSIEIPSSITSIGEAAFSFCAGLTSIEIPSSVTSIGAGAFQDCTGLTSINIPNSVTSITDYLFNNCTSLESVTIQNPNINYLGWRVFGGCASLTNLTLFATTPPTLHTGAFHVASISNIDLNIMSPIECANPNPYSSTTAWAGFKSYNCTIIDNAAPVFENSTPITSSINQTGFAINTDIDESGTIYYVVVVDGATAPTSVEVKAGTASGGGGAVKSGNASVTSGGFTNAFSVTGLTAETSYDVYVVAQDDEGAPNLQATPTKIDVSTSGLVLSISQINVTGNGLSNGSATVTITGGIQPYFIQWSTGDTSATATGLVAGDYTVTVRDDNGNGDPKMSGIITITQPDKLVVTIASQTNISAYGASTGAVTVAVTGGVAPYTYQWNTGDTSATISGYPAGDYNVRVTDAKGIIAENNDCIESLCVKLLQPPSVTTNAATNIVADAASLSGFVSSDGGATIIERGILLSKTNTNLNPKIGDLNLFQSFSFTNLTSSFLGEPDFLDINVSYSFVVYARNSVGTTYGMVKTFTPKTPMKPTVNTVAADTISMTRATVGRIIVDEGSSPVTESGVIYALTDANPDPQIGDGNSVQLDSGSFTYAHLGYHSYRTYIDNLSPGTNYTIKAYAINSVGTSYGAIKTFNTKPKTPTILFSDSTVKFSTTAFYFGAASDSGGAITYSIVSAPTFETLVISGGTAITGAVGQVVVRATQAASGIFSSGIKDMTLTIEKGDQTIALATLANKTYGDADFNLTGTSSSGLAVTYVSSNTAVATVSGNTVSIVGAGSTNITATQTGNTNYNAASDVMQELTVDKATLTATAENKSREYGDANPTFTITYSGFKGSDSITDIDSAPTASSTATVTKNAGTAIILLSAATDNNYTITSNTGTLTISKATLIVTAKNHTSNYGDNFSIDFEYGTFKNGEDATVLNTGAYVSIVGTFPYNVGTYTIVSDAVDDNNYIPSYVNGVLTVNKAHLNVIAEAKSKTYGDANPTLTFTYSGFKNNETSSVIDTEPTATTTATIATNVGTATISVSGGSDTNYAISYTSGTLTIGKATLTATALDKSREYGDVNPAFTVSYVGFKGSDSVTDLDTAPSASSSATVTTSVGTEVIM
ncbi:MAG: leucine-rich repeat protein, partial [Flavobacteriaceae bacterium]|nr:leucine-rich repeat protein [Flavobacteriaceae bacterium]